MNNYFLRLRHCEEGAKRLTKQSRINKYSQILGLFCGIILISAALVFGAENEKIIYNSLIDGFWQICTMDTDGASKLQLTWSPEDKRYPVFLRDQKKILFRTNNNELYVMDINGKNQERILKDSGSLGDAIYSPFTGKIVYVRFREETRDTSDLWISDLDGGDKEVLTNKYGLQICPFFSPDGKKIIYTAGHGYGTHEIFLLNLQDKSTIQLTKNKALDFMPVFSPDGTKIAYVSNSTGNYEIWLMNAGGGNKEQLTDNEAIDTRPFWSPDGKEIVFVSARSGSLQIWKMSFRGDNPLQLTSESESQDPCWISYGQ